MKEKCRACLSKSLLFDWNAIVAGTMSYADLFFHITSLSKQNFEHMQMLCNNCGSKIDEIYNFIQKANRAEHILRNETCVREEIEQLEAKSNTENLSIEIAPFTGEEIQIQSEIETVKEEYDSEYSQDETYIDSIDDCANFDTTERQNSDDIKFETVDVNRQDNNLEEDFLADDSSQSDILEKRQNVKRKADKSSLVCEYCGRTFKSESYRKRHMVVHMEGHRILCDVCPRTFKDVYNLKKHKKTHDENRPRDYSCQHCDLKFLTRNALKGHQEIHDDKREKRFPCDQCDKAFFQKGALNVHRRIHTGNMVQCDICDKRYPRLVDLEIHMRSHTGELPFKCTTCNKTFKYRSSLYNHVRQAHFGYIYKCSNCSKQYKDKHALLEHKKIHKDSVFKCALCDKEMVKKYRLKTHMKAVHKIHNPIELEQLIISGRAERKYRTMRRFTNVEYKVHMAQPVQGLSSTSYLKIVPEVNDESIENSIQQMEEEYISDC